MSSNNYQSPIERSNAFMVKVEDLVREIVIQNNIPYYRIESRMEHNAQATDGNNYLPVVRVITYFEDSVTPLSAVLRSEFDVEIEAPKDQQVIKVDSFSSKHVEYKVTLKENRLGLTEYKRYGTKQFEIQVCSMIQDAWNGIERELGYNGGTIPDEAKRDFYRVGALLEMADIEFLKIRSLLNKNPEEDELTIKPDEYIPQQIVATPQPQLVAAPIYEEQKPVTNIFASQPISYQPAPLPTAPIVQEPVVVAQQINQVVNDVIPQAAMPVNNPIGLAPQKVAINNTVDTNINVSQPVVANINNVEMQNGIVQDKISEIINTASVFEQVAPVFQPQAPVYSAPPPAPVEEKQPEPAKQNIDYTAPSNINVNAHGIVEKAAEPIREQAQQAATPFYEEKPKSAPAPLDENAQMSDASLKEYVLNSKLLREIDSQISVRAGAKLNDEIDIEGDVERLRFLKVFSLKQLHERLADNKNDIISFAEKWIGKDNGGSFDMGISLFYLEYLLVGKKNDPGFAVEYVLKFISDNDYSARYIIPTYNSIRQADSGVAKFSHLTLK